MKKENDKFKNDVEHIITKALDDYGCENVLNTLRMLGVYETSLFRSQEPGLVFFAVNTTLKKCTKKEIGEAEEESKISVQVTFLRKKGRVSDSIELVDESGKSIYKWTWHGPKANDGATWTGKWKGKIFLHFKGRDNEQDVKYDLKILS